MKKLLLSIFACTVVANNASNISATGFKSIFQITSADLLASRMEHTAQYDPTFCDLTEEEYQKALHAGTQESKQFIESHTLSEQQLDKFAAWLAFRSNEFNTFTGFDTGIEAIIENLKKQVNPIDPQFLETFFTFVNELEKVNFFDPFNVKLNRHDSSTRQAIGVDDFKAWVGSQKNTLAYTIFLAISGEFVEKRFDMLDFFIKQLAARQPDGRTLAIKLFQENNIDLLEIDSSNGWL